MNKRELYKTFEHDGRTFRIGKFDAMTGSYIVYKLMAGALPMGMGDIVGIPMPQNNQVMGKKEFFDLQADCLKVCVEMLPAGPAPVLNENGTYGVEDAENNVPLIMMLTIQALIWNVKDFFTAELLTSMSGALSIIFPQNAQT